MGKAPGLGLPKHLLSSALYVMVPDTAPWIEGSSAFKESLGPLADLEVLFPRFNL